MVKTCSTCQNLRVKAGKRYCAASWAYLTSTPELSEILGDITGVTRYSLGCTSYTPILN